MLERNPALRFAFIRQGEDAVLLFVGGARYVCNGAAALVAQRICAKTEFELDHETLRDPGVEELIVDLINRGYLAPD